ncbi:MAG TPA: hypothetical protein VIL33_05620 [Rhodothermia bacterium]
MCVWRRTLWFLVITPGGTASTEAQTDLCSIHYQAYAGGIASSQPDAAGDLILAFGDGAVDQLVHTDTFDDVIPPLAPPGGWFVALSNPSDSGLFWGRSDARLIDPAPGTEATFHVLLYPRFDETAVDSVELSWPADCFTPPNVTVLSMAACGSEEFIVADMTSVGEVGIGRPSSSVWDDDQICLAIGASDDLIASVKLFLEGPFTGPQMSTPAGYSDHIPLSQPYSDVAFDGTALDFDSVQVVAGLPDGTVDWVLVDLRSSAAPQSVLAASRHAAVLLEDGTVVETDSTPLRFPGIATGGYHLVARHRNHSSVMSADTLDLSDGIGSWDFTTALAKAHSNGGAPMRNLGSGVFGLFAADGNADGQVTAPDFNQWNAATTAGETGYRQPDFNLDGQVTAPDFNLWNANTTAGASSQVPD